MKITHVDHIAINTLEIEESIHFYSNILGFRLDNKVDFEGETLVYVWVNETTRMELCDLRGKCTKKQPYNTTEGGLRHIAFDVDDLFSWEKYLEENNVPFELKMTELPNLGKRALLIYDPSGTCVELCCDL